MGIEDLSYIGEIWKPIENFPMYEISNYGEVANIETDLIIRPSATLQGALKIGLVKDGRQYTRSVKVLVARTFVDGEDAIFDTPMLLNGDQFDCRAENIVWRPRWFSWNYARQIDQQKDIYKLGPLIEIDESGIVVNAYHNTIEASLKHGLLFADVWDSIHTGKPVFPTRQIFRFADKV